jgi:Ca2+-binding RTX toxin-like protein
MIVHVGKVHQMHSHEAVRGTAGDDVLLVTHGGLLAFGGNDTITATAQDDFTQIHTYAAAGHDLTYLDFGDISGFAHGHHVRGGAGEDSFDFTNIDNVSGFVVGRIEDFDDRSDELRIDGQVLDLGSLPDHVRVVSFNGQHDDPGSVPQPWLHIATVAGGDILYALEGARVDMDQVAAQEPHFLKAPIDPWALPEIDYENPKNYLPDAHDPVNGLLIEDTDVDREDVVENIFGSDFDDLIAAGLNDDIVDARGGNDNIFAGSGNDLMLGGAGHDKIDGSSGNDIMDGGTGRDDLTGGEGEDLFVFADFDRGFDVIRDFVPGTDQIVIDHPGMDSVESLRFVKFKYEDTRSALIRFRDENGSVDKSLGGIVLKGVNHKKLSEDDFIFGDPPDLDPEGEEEIDQIKMPDEMVGTSTSEHLDGSVAADFLLGMGGRDTIDAGAGNDIMDGGTGRDDLTGGEGEDLFVFADFDRGFDVIRDFVPGTDQIVIDHPGMDSVESLRFVKFKYEDTRSALIRFRDENGSVDKSLGGIVLKGVNHKKLSEDDFIFGDPPDLDPEGESTSEGQSTEALAGMPMAHSAMTRLEEGELIEALFNQPTDPEEAGGDMSEHADHVNMESVS